MLTGIILWLGKSPIGQLILGYVWHRLYLLIKDEIAHRKEQERIKVEAQKSMEALKNATTADEIDKASDSAVSGF